MKRTHYHVHTNSSDGPPLLPEALLWQHRTSARTTTQVSLCDGHVQRRLKPDSQQDHLYHLYVCVYVCKSQYISSRSLLTACQSALSPSFTSFVSLLLDLDPHIHPSLARPVPALLHHPDCSTFFIINSKITLIYCCPRGRIQANIEQTPSIHRLPRQSSF